MRIWLIRHGEAEGNQAGLYLGQRSNVSLTANGRSQAKHLARVLAACPWTAVYTSDLARARETAEIVAEPHGLVPVAVSELRELDFGLWDGLGYEQICAAWPEEWQAWRRAPERVAPPGGETVLELRARVTRFLVALEAQHPRGAVAVVSHGGPLRVLWAGGNADWQEPWPPASWRLRRLP